MQIIDGILDYSKLEASGELIYSNIHEIYLIFPSAVKLEFSGFSVENMVAVSITTRW
jgi:hypothetical protein